jgi:hypothetical protein
VRRAAYPTAAVLGECVVSSLPYGEGAPARARERLEGSRRLVRRVLLKGNEEGTARAQQRARKGKDRSRDKQRDAERDAARKTKGHS